MICHPDYYNSHEIKQNREHKTKYCNRRNRQISWNTAALYSKNHDDSSYGGGVSGTDKSVLFHTSDHNYLQFIAFQGEHDIILKRITQDDKDEIKVNGVKLFSFCLGFVNTIKSLL